MNVYVCVCCHSLLSLVWAKTNLRRKGYILAYSSVIKGSQCRNSSRNLEVGAEAQTLEEHCLLDCSSNLCSVQDYLPRDGTSNSGLSPPTSLINSENASQTSPIEEYPS